MDDSNRSDKKVPCPKCDGTGNRALLNPVDLYQTGKVITCEFCLGTGEVWECPLCEGKGCDACQENGWLQTYDEWNAVVDLGTERIMEKLRRERRAFNDLTAEQMGGMVEVFMRGMNGVLDKWSDLLQVRGNAWGHPDKYVHLLGGLIGVYVSQFSINAGIQPGAMLIELVKGLADWLKREYPLVGVAIENGLDEMARVAKDAHETDKSKMN